MRAEALNPALALVSPGPVIEFPSQIADLLPQQTRRPITTPGLKLHDRCGDFDYPGVEISRTARGQLKRFAGARNHSVSHQAAGITKDFFRTPSASVDEKIKFRFQPDHRAYRRCPKSAETKTMGVTFCSAVFHLLNARLTRFA